MRIQSQQGFWSGVMFVAIGVFFSAIARNYAMGTSAAMGPGYLPFWLGVILAILGAVIAILALSPKSEQPEIAAPVIGVVLLVLGSVTLFGLILPILCLSLSVF